MKFGYNGPSSFEEMLKTAPTPPPLSKKKKKNAPPPLSKKKKKKKKKRERERENPRSQSLHGTPSDRLTCLVKIHSVW